MPLQVIHETPKADSWYLTSDTGIVREVIDDVSLKAKKDANLRFLAEIFHTLRMATMIFVFMALPLKSASRSLFLERFVEIGNRAACHFKDDMMRENDRHECTRRQKHQLRKYEECKTKQPR